MSDARQRRYSRVYRRVWNDAKFRRLTPAGPNGQTLWLRLLTGPELTNIPGIFVGGEAALAEALGWPLEGFREAFAEVSREGLAKADWKARLVWVPKAIHYNRPESINVIKSWRTAWDELPECGLKSEAYQVLRAFAEDLSEAFREAFDDACPNPSPIQEQDQDQEQEREIPPLAGARVPVREGARHEAPPSPSPPVVTAPPSAETPPSRPVRVVPATLPPSSPSGSVLGAVLAKTPWAVSVVEALRMSMGGNAEKGPFREDVVSAAWLSFTGHVDASRDPSAPRVVPFVAGEWQKWLIRQARMGDSEPRRPGRAPHVQQRDPPGERAFRIASSDWGDSDS